MNISFNSWSLTKKIHFGFPFVPSSFRGCPVFACVMCRSAQPISACHPLLSCGSQWETISWPADWRRPVSLYSSTTTSGILAVLQWCPWSIVRGAWIEREFFDFWFAVVLYLNGFLVSKLFFWMLVKGVELGFSWSYVELLWYHVSTALSPFEFFPDLMSSLILSSYSAYLSL